MASADHGADVLDRHRRDLDDVDVTGRPPSALPWLDLADVARSDLGAMPMAVEQWVPSHGVTLIGSHGGGGKTVLAGQLALCWSAGRQFLGREVARHRVLLILYESSRSVAHRRIRRTAQALGIDLERLAEDGDLHVLVADEAADGLLLFGREPQLDERGRPFVPHVAATTTAYVDLKRTIQSLGITALVIDPVTDAFDGDEVNRRDVRAFIGALRKLVPGPVVVTVHVNRASARSGRPGDAWSGSTAWHNSARARIELLPANPGDVEDDPAVIRQDDGIRTLHLAKNNDGPSGLQLEVRLDFADWVFVPTMPTIAGSDTVDSIRRSNDVRWLVEFIRDAAEKGDPVHASDRANRNPHARVIARDDCPARFKGQRGKKALFVEINRMREAGDLTTEDQTTGTRNKVTVLTVPACASCASE